MFRALSVFTVGCTFLVAGCRDDNNNFKPVDLSMSMDDMGTGGVGDMKMPITYAPHTIKEIDTGTVSQHQAVHISGAIVTTVVAFFKAKSGTLCRYQVFVQDPSCTMNADSPCGIVLQSDGPMVSNNTCPRADMSNTPIGNLKQGDQVDIDGFTDTFSNAAGPDAGVSGTVVQHSIDANKVTVTASKQTLPTPVDIADQTVFAPYAGTGWQKYEGMLVKLSTVTIASVDSFGNYTTCPQATPACASPAKWGNDFSFLYRYVLGGDAGSFPTQGANFSSITGVVNTVFGGSLVATGSADFKM